MLVWSRKHWEHKYVYLHLWKTDKNNLLWDWGSNSEVTYSKMTYMIIILIATDYCCQTLIVCLILLIYELMTHGWRRVFMHLCLPDRWSTCYFCVIIVFRAFIKNQLMMFRRVISQPFVRSSSTNKRSLSVL